MSDAYQVLIDHAATPDDAADIATLIRDVLIEEGLIGTMPNSECVLNGEGYPPGKRLTSIYNYGPHELRYWDMLNTIGVKIYAERYVNVYAFTVFEYSICPQCGRRFNDDPRVMDQLGDSIGAFLSDNRVDLITCPECAGKVPCNAWTTVPDVGICHLAIEFWNWPSFDAKGWTLSVPDLVSRRTGRVLSQGWGRL